MAWCGGVTVIVPKDFNILTVLAHCCPGTILSKEMETSLMAALSAANYDAHGTADVCPAVLAAVLPHMPDGTAPQYTLGAPPVPPLAMPGAVPVVTAALPPQPVAEAGIGAVPVAGTVGVFPWGLPRFQDSNPTPLDNWSIDYPGVLGG
jgi:hypothetical protein